MEKRYVLQAESRGMGNHFYCTFEDAKVEAERLCRKERLPIKIWEYKMKCLILSAGQIFR